jgi:hypothetical protein
VRNLGSIVSVLFGAVHNRGHHFTMRSRVAFQFVRDHPPGRLPSTFQHLTKKDNGSLFVSSFLNQGVNSIVVLVNGTVDIVTLTADTHKHFIDEPGVSAMSSLAAQSIRIPGAELVAPACGSSHRKL